MIDNESYLYIRMLLLLLLLLMLMFSCQPFTADIWAMMVTLYVIIFRRYPFSNPDEIKRCQLDFRSLQARMSDDLYDLFTSTLIREPVHRLTMHEIERHNWIQQPFPHDSYTWTSVTQNCLGKRILSSIDN
jgi:serine/threonine protein kinase